MYQPAPAAPSTEPTITAGGQKFAAVEKFTYLESILPRTVTMMKRSPTELHVQVQPLAGYTPVCGNKVVSSYRPKVWCTVWSFCLPCCMPVRLGQSTVTSSFHMMHCTCCSTSNSRTGFQTPKSFWEQIWWIYVQCSRYPSWDWQGICVPYMMSTCQSGTLSDLKTAKHYLGGQKKCYKDTVKVSLKCSGISPDTWEEAAQVHMTWYSLMTAYEEYTESVRPSKRTSSRRAE